MAEQDNVRTVQEAYEAFGRGDIAAVLARMNDDVEWVVPGPKEMPTAGKWLGRDQVRQFFTAVAQTMELQPFEPREFIAQGDIVVVLGSYGGRVKATGRHFSSEWVMTFRFRNGKVARFQEYTDTDSIAAAFRSEGRRAAAA